MTGRTERLADQFEMLAAHGRQLSEFAATYDIDLDPIARSTQIDPADFSDLKARISMDRFCRLLEALAAISGDPAFGLKFGLFFKHGSTGPYGYGLANAPTFKDALRFVIKYTPIQVDFDVLSMVNNGNRVIIEWRFTPLITQCDQFMDFSAAVVFRQLRSCAGSQFRLLEAQLQRSSPRDKPLYSSTFFKGIRFNAAINRISLPLDLLEISNPSADPMLYELMSSQCKDAADSLIRNKDIVTLLKEDFIHHMMGDDRAIDDVARRIGMSRRTLQRRLEEVDTTYWQVFEDLRDELSMRLLTETELSLTEISNRLGYSTQSAYTRAVKRWHGKTPGQIRALPSPG